MLVVYMLFSLHQTAARLTVTKRCFCLRLTDDCLRMHFLSVFGRNGDHYLKFLVLVDQIGQYFKHSIVILCSYNIKLLHGKIPPYFLFLV